MPRLWKIISINKILMTHFHPKNIVDTPFIYFYLDFLKIFWKHYLE